MKKNFTLGILLFMTCYLYAQNISDTIVTKKALGVIFVQNGRNLTPRSLLEITKSNDEAYKEMKIAKNNYDAGQVFGMVGGFMVGWPIGTAVAGGNPNWTLAAAGAGLIIISIPFSSAYSKHAKKAVNIYNNGLKQTGINAVDFIFGWTGNGIGLRADF